ncbi:hypothetical protein F5148DRAFT_1182346 [Russula earlei]|uniref:Uncharacterized protein n=1 Tax=Russula earlei TaxID=71964 RepID=A0ACC0UG60_9AGAM|nr:hypothetical protein F5148DRAFT_1182346 [Russula earlei]
MFPRMRVPRTRSPSLPPPPYEDPSTSSVPQNPPLLYSTPPASDPTPHQRHGSNPPEVLSRHSLDLHDSSVVPPVEATLNSSSSELRIQLELEATGSGSPSMHIQSSPEEEQAAAKAEARNTVQSCIRSLLVLRYSSDEDRVAVFSKCSEACQNVGLDLSAVLQERLIEGQIPVYWVILNRPTSSEVDDGVPDPLITTITSVRVACMLSSNNALLQQLFGLYPSLPSFDKDALLLPPSERDVVDVKETGDGTGVFIAYIKIRRFRLRMSVSRGVKVEFVTRDRFWTASFTMDIGPTETKWLFSLELSNNSTLAYVDADLLISSRHSHPSNHNSDDSDSLFTVSIGRDGCMLQPGPEHAIEVRLDDCDMGHHWVNESVALTDADGTLHAELKVRLTRPIPQSTQIVIISPVSLPVIILVLVFVYGYIFF